MVNVGKYIMWRVTTMGHRIGKKNQGWPHGPCPNRVVIPWARPNRVEIPDLIGDGVKLGTFFDTCLVGGR